MDSLIKNNSKMNKKEFEIKTNKYQLNYIKIRNFYLIKNLLWKY